MKSKVIQFTFAVRQWNEDVEGTIAGKYYPGSPAVMYLRNGDPGYPADPSEFELHEVLIESMFGQKLAESVSLDDKGQEQFWTQHEDKILEWADDCYSDQYDGPDD